MVKRLLYMICVAFSCVACSQDGGMGSKDKILIDVVSSSVTSKATIIEDEVVKQRIIDFMNWKINSPV